MADPSSHPLPNLAPIGDGPHESVDVAGPSSRPFTDAQVEEFREQDRWLPTSEAAEKCLNEKRKTLNGEDILTSMRSLGFDNYEGVLRVYLAKYRDAQIPKGAGDNDDDVDTKKKRGRGRQSDGQASESKGKRKKNIDHDAVR
ncbi:uncharacterized protein IL334_005403 [Kwoniella shivajii]|uniref:Uncharacterized protein n=1 Tax=Kwoniella shivajii TaxID=564305 RepID=A0ABZ1D728_9TREE|nr:hypothetical protein IL334_005403 [Kwoniella shivajii]